MQLSADEGGASKGAQGRTKGRMCRRVVLTTGFGSMCGFGVERSSWPFSAVSFAPFDVGS